MEQAVSQESHRSEWFDKFAADMEQLRKSQQETDRIMKEASRIVGRLGNRFGELAEHMVRSSIMEKFNALGFHFTESSEDKLILEPDNPYADTEIDILLENDDAVIAVEVKAKPVHKDVDVHAHRMEILRSRANTRHDTRKYQGAIAGAIMTKEVRNYSHQTGFYVIEQTGDTVKITIPEGFVPRVW